MASMVSSSVDYGFDPGRIKLKTIKLVFAASLLSMWHYGVRARNLDNVFQVQRNLNL